MLVLLAGSQVPCPHGEPPSGWSVWDVHRAPAPSHTTTAYCHGGRLVAYVRRNHGDTQPVGCGIQVTGQIVKIVLIDGPDAKSFTS